MAITSLDGIVAGAQYPREFMKVVTGTMIAGKPFALHPLAGIPAVSVLGNAPGNLPNNWTITAISKTNPTTITVTGTHPWANNDIVSFQGTDCVPSLDGQSLALTSTGASTFTVPFNVSTTAGTTGRVSGQTGAGGDSNNGFALTSFSGQIPFSNPGAGNTYLSRFLGYSDAQAGVLLLCDRLLHTGGYMPTKTTAQAGTLPVRIPPRDANGTNNGDGVFAALEVYSVLGASTATPTISYLNQSGNTSTGTAIVALAATALAGTFIPFSLAAGDTGVRAINSLTLGATASSGILGVVLYRVLARLELPSAIPNAIDAITGGFARMYDNTCPFLVFIPNTTTTTKISGQVIWTQG